ncbi:MAG: hypothetical protein ABEI97_05570 [Candidatus Nanohaloarchaea archaeon]
MDLDEELGKLKDTDIALVIADAEEYVSVNQQLLDHLVNGEGLAGIYVTVNKPYLTIVDTLEAAGIGTSEIFFIDAISEDTGAEDVTAENVAFLDSPQGLTDMSIAISEAVEKLPDEGNRVLVLDTLSTLMLYNDEDLVSQFAHELSGKIRDWGVKGLMLTIQEEADEDLLASLNQFVDEAIHVGQ